MAVGRARLWPCGQVRLRGSGTSSSHRRTGDHARPFAECRAQHVPCSEVSDLEVTSSWAYGRASPHPYPGSWRSSQMARPFITNAWWDCQSETHCQLSEYPDGFSSTAETPVTFQRLIPPYKTATCNGSATNRCAVPEAGKGCTAHVRCSHCAAGLYHQAEHAVPCASPIS